MSNLMFVSTQVGFYKILSPVRIPGIDKGMFKMVNNTNSVVAQGLSEFRCVCFVNIKSVINLDYILIYLVLIDDSRASVYLDGIDRRILVPSAPVMGGWNNQQHDAPGSACSSSRKVFASLHFCCLVRRRDCLCRYLRFLNGIHLESITNTRTC